MIKYTKPAVKAPVSIDTEVILSTVFTGCPPDNKVYKGARGSGKIVIKRPSTT